MEQSNRDHLNGLLKKMDLAARTFYRLAQDANVHQLLEFTGFINEYVKLCQKSWMNGVDFVENAELPMEEYNAQYIAEKLNCIFGPTFLAKEELRKAFIEELFDGRFKLVKNVPMTPGGVFEDDGMVDE